MTAFQRMMKDPRRAKIIRDIHCEVIGVNYQTPVGFVELWIEKGWGPHCLLISMLGEKKVAVPFPSAGKAKRSAPRQHFQCKLLVGDPLGYGMWFPFSVYQDEPYVISEGREPGMFSRGSKLWQFHCLAPDGAPVCVPVPRYFHDVDRRRVIVE